MKTITAVLWTIILSLACVTARAGDVYVANFAGDSVDRITPDGSLFTVITPVDGVTAPRNMTFDSQGNFYVMDVFGSIFRRTTGGVLSLFVDSSAFPFAFGMTYGLDGMIYVSNPGTNTIHRVSMGGVVSNFVTGVTSPYNMAFDTSGNLFVGSEGSTILRITAGGSISTFATGFTNLECMAFNATGDLFVTDMDTILRITSSGVISTFVDWTGMGMHPVALAFDEDGLLYASDTENNIIWTITEAGIPNILSMDVNDPEGLVFAPVPEPTTGMLVIAGAVGILIAFRRRFFA